MRNKIKKICLSLKTKYIDYKAGAKYKKQLKDGYRDLAPIDKIPNGEEYLKALHWAITNKRVKNIALTGPYGSGKSSIINYYLKRHPIIKNKHLRISMATFIENARDEKGEHIRIAVSQNQIEEGILKQLFYKVSYRRIPQSRYRKIHKVGFWYIWCAIFLLISIAAVFAFIFFPEHFNNFLTLATDAGGKLGLSEKESIIEIGLLLLGLISIFSYIWRQLYSRFRLKEVKIHDTTINSETNDSQSIFNKNMDEIVYFFEETKYRVVFFEELDRLEESKIFIQLKELNTLLNNSDMIKRPIVFVYAVRDDIFTEKDRTKFFDFIIPVIPVINSTNSGEILLELLQAGKDDVFKHDISQDYVLDIAPYISDMRVLQNIYNEFLLYKRILIIEQKLELSDKLMMSLIVFKNLYPKDFADLQMEEGIVKQAFNDGQLYVKLKQDALEREIKTSVDMLNNVKNDTIENTKELKVALLSALTAWNGVTKSVKKGYAPDITAEKIMEEKFDLSKLCIGDDWTVSYNDWSNSNLTRKTVPNFTDICTSYYKRYNYLKVSEDRHLKAILQDVDNQKQLKHSISIWPLKRLIEEHGADVVLSEQVRNNKLLVFMLRKGYIDEKYVDYINYFKGNSITKDDMNFILSVKNREPRHFDYVLFKESQVLQRLQPHEFEQKEIYNFSLLEYMLSCTDYDDKLHIMINQLSDESDISWKFIDEFMMRTLHVGRFVKLLSSNWQSMWAYIYNDPILTDTRKAYYLSMLCSYTDVKNIFDLNYNGLISKFIEEHDDILQQLSTVEPNRMISIISALKITFTKLKIEGIDRKILEFVFCNRYYQINTDMIRSVVAYKNPLLCDRLNFRNYTIITYLRYMPLTDYIHENLDVYIDNVVLADENTSEDDTQILALIERIITDCDRCRRIIQHEVFCISDITLCCGKLISTHKEAVHAVWNDLFDYNKVDPSWENVHSYWIDFGLTDTLMGFIIKHVDALSKKDSSCLDEDLKWDIIESNISSDVFSKLLHKIPLQTFDVPLKNIQPVNVNIMIKNHFFDFTSGIYQELANCYPCFCVEFILENQSVFLELIKEISLTRDVFEGLVLSKKTDIVFKRKLIGFCGSTCMSETVAKQLCSLDIFVEKDVFYAAWATLDADSKGRLLLRNLEILNVLDFEKCFEELEQPYQTFSDRSKRHEVRLLDNEDNRKLAKRLQQVGYITSYDYTNVRGCEPNKQKPLGVSVIRCRVKASPKQ